MLGALRAACDEMGAVLVRSAHSANVKERRDASTALFDADGRMVMQAEHIPVHLGAMPSAVASVLDRGPRARRRLDPQRPVRGRHPPAGHHGDLARLRRTASSSGFAASRAHHADVGAKEPGSMPADSRTLEDEGVVIPPTRLVAAGELDREFLDSPDRAHAQPAPARGRPARPARREPHGRRAARRRWRSGWGSPQLRAGLRGDPRLRRAPHARADRGARRWRAHRGGRARGPRRRPRAFGCAPPCAATGSSSTSTGTDPQHDGNLNCPLAVTLSACYFAMRVLTDPDVPACAGAYRPLDGAGRPRAACSTPARPPPSPRATWRPRRAWPTSCWPPSAARSARAR